MSISEKSVTLSPSWRAFFWSYFLGVILVPILIGFVLLWKTWKKNQEISYKITDRSITVIEGNYSQNIYLADIRQVNAGSLRFGVGAITLKTRGREIELIGIKKPKSIAESIEKAAEAEQKRLEALKQTKPAPPQYDPGTMDRLDYLTGLWQQGLITEEEFNAEKKNLN